MFKKIKIKDFYFYKCDWSRVNTEFEWAYNTAKNKFIYTTDYDQRSCVGKFTHIFFGDLAKNIVKSFLLSKCFDLHIIEYDREREDEFRMSDVFDLMVMGRTLEIKSSLEKYTNELITMVQRRRIMILKRENPEHAPDYRIQVFFIPKTPKNYWKFMDTDCKCRILSQHIEEIDDLLPKFREDIDIYIASWIKKEDELKLKSKADLTVCGHGAIQEEELYINKTRPLDQLLTEFQNTYQRIDKKGELKEDGQYILFGEYPQSKKAELISIICKTPDNRGYYLGSDGYYYAKATASPHDEIYKFKDGTSVLKGEVYYFKVEPIKWKILSSMDDSALLLCEDIISNGPYIFQIEQDEEYPMSNSAIHEIKECLNNDLYNKAFNMLQKNAIRKTPIRHHSSDKETNSKIFLPCREMVYNAAYGFVNTEYGSKTRCKELSDYCIATGGEMGLNTCPSRYGAWWLRASKRELNQGDLINIIDNYGELKVANINDNKIGVVPALIIELNDKIIKSKNS